VHIQPELLPPTVSSNNNSYVVNISWWGTYIVLPQLVSYSMCMELD